MMSILRSNRAIGGGKRVEELVAGKAVFWPPHFKWDRVFGWLIVGGLLLLAMRVPEARSAEEPSGPVSGERYSAATLYNQANAEAKEGKTGWAIVKYERAHLLSPGDEDILANLHAVRTKAGLPDLPESWLSRVLAFASPNTLAWTGCGGLVLIGLGIFLLGILPQQRVTLLVGTIAGVLLVTLSLASALATWPVMNTAVIVAHQAPARISPSSFAETAFQFQEGETVGIQSEHADFVLVQNSAGRLGWVMRPDLVRIVPHS